MFSWTVCRFCCFFFNFSKYFHLIPAKRISYYIFIPLSTFYCRSPEHSSEFGKSVIDNKRQKTKAIRTSSEMSGSSIQVRSPTPIFPFSLQPLINSASEKIKNSSQLRLELTSPLLPWEICFSHTAVLIDWFTRAFCKR